MNPRKNEQQKCKTLCNKEFPSPAFHPKARDNKRTLAGLLACSMLNTFPEGFSKDNIFTRPRYLRAVSSGMKIQHVEEMLPPGTYSYGDSAGFTPDFPFNPPVRGEPKSLQRWEYPL